MSKFYAVRVILTLESGSTIERDYVRGPMRLGREAFAAFALGDVLRLTREGWTCYRTNVSWDLYEISESEVRA